MEKIVIGVPYEISIEPSIDIGKFDAEIVLSKQNFNVSVKLKKIKGTDIDYSFIIPTSLKDILKKAQTNYSIFVYKENARFEVDDGKIKFIDEKDFKVRVTDNVKMRPMEEENEDDSKSKPKETEVKKNTKDKTPEPSAKPSTNENIDPASFAEQLIADNLNKAGQSEDIHVDEDTVQIRRPEPTPMIDNTGPSVTQNERDLRAILSEIEQKKQDRLKKEQINKNIRDALHKS